MVERIAVDAECTDELLVIRLLIRVYQWSVVQRAKLYNYLVLQFLCDFNWKYLMCQFFQNFLEHGVNHIVEVKVQGGSSLRSL